MSGLLSRADVIGVGIYISQVPLGRPWRNYMLSLKGQTASLALPCAEPVLHLLDYRIELISFRNWIRYG